MPHPRGNRYTLGAIQESTEETIVCRVPVGDKGPTWHGGFEFAPRPRYAKVEEAFNATWVTQECPKCKHPGAVLMITRHVKAGEEVIAALPGTFQAKDKEGVVLAMFDGGGQRTWTKRKDPSARSRGCYLEY